MKNRKTRNINFPHPLIKNLNQIKQYKPQISSKLPPSSFETFITHDYQNPCPHIFRPTTYSIGSTPQINQLVQLGFIVQPFSLCCRNITQIDIQNKTLISCNKCGSIINNKYCRINSELLQCNICQNRILSEISEQQQNYGDKINESILDFSLEKDSSDQEERIVFIIEISEALAQTEFLQSFVQNIKNLINCKVSNQKIGFILYDKNIYFFPNQFEEEPQIMVWSDHQNLQQIISLQNFFFSIEDEIKINKILKSIQNLLAYTTNKKISCIDSVLKYISQYIKNSKILIFLSIQSNYPEKQIVKKVIINKQNTNDPMIKLQNYEFKNKKKIESLINQFKKNNLCIHLFVLSDKNVMNISKYSNIYQSTGGMLFHYKMQNLLNQQFYYDLYNLITSKNFNNVQVQVKLSKGLKIKSIIVSNRYQTSKEKLTFSQFNQRSTLTVNYELQKQIEVASIQILIYYSSNKCKKLRTINFNYTVSNKLEEILNQIGDEALFFCNLRKQIICLSQNQCPSHIMTNLINNLKKLVLKCKQTQVSSFDFTIPSCLKLFCFYLGQLFNQKYFKKWGSLASNERFYYYYKMCALNLEELSKSIYMKMYQIDNMTESKHFSRYQVPKNIKFESTNIQLNGIYLIDNGKFLFLLIGQECSRQKLAQIFGKKDVNKITEENCGLIQSEYSAKINKIIQVLRNRHLNNYLILKTITNGQNMYQNLICESFYNEDKFKVYLHKLI